MSKQNHQRGAVLICALAMVAAMSAAALILLDGMRLAIRSSANLESRQRARYYADAAILASLYTLEQAAQKKHVETLLYTEKPSELPFVDGNILTSFREGSHCLNLNALRSTNRQTSIRAQTVLTRLLENSDKTPEMARQYVAALADWMDKDDSPRKGGAEDLYYTSLRTPYRTSGQKLADVSELHRIAGFKPTLVNWLQDFVCTRPDSKMHLLNVNMLQPQHAPLLAAYCGSGLSVDTAKILISQRPINGYQRLGEFMDILKSLQQVVSNDCQQTLSVKTQFVDVSIMVEIQESELDVSAMLKINSNGKANEIFRKFGPA